MSTVSHALDTIRHYIQLALPPEGPHDDRHELSDAFRQLADELERLDRSTTAAEKTVGLIAGPQKESLGFIRE